MRIFIIDDDPFSIHITESMLLMEDKGLEVEVKGFLSASDALRELQAGTVPGIIFLDLNMPVLDGWGFLEAVSPGLQGKSSIYILTSSLDLADLAKSREYPIVSGFIHKPITEEDIKLALARTDSLQIQLD